MAVYKYQVWSSVLGQAVATMDPSGNQIENRIYAGSTLIATARGRHTTGTSADDSIEFHVKEPVTNTTATYAYNATTSNWATAEQEPFGQNISTIDPYIEEWNNYGQVLNGAQDPEWQCAMYDKFKDGFSQMPIHCQKAAMQKDNFGYDTKFWNGRSSDLTNLATAGAHSTASSSPPASSGEGPSKEIPAEATTATNKTSKDEADNNCKRGPNGQFAEFCENNPDRPDPIDEYSAQNGILAPLERIEEESIRNASSELGRRLSDTRSLGADCKNMVLDKLAGITGFSLNSFLEFLGRKANFFDGTRSTVPQNDYQPNKGYLITVAERFANEPIVKAETAIRPDLPFTVFFRPGYIDTDAQISPTTGEKLAGIDSDNLALIFHEGLHGYGIANGTLSSFDDTALKILFGTVDSKGKVKPLEGNSITISNYIKRHCF